MGRWFRTSATAPAAAAAQPDSATARRIALLDVTQFWPWIENCLFAVEKAMLAYEREPNQPELLEEALDASRICTLLLEEFQRRMTGPAPR